MMKSFRLVLIWLGVAAMLGMVACYYYVEAQGRTFLERKLSTLFEQPVSIADVRFLPPFGFRFKNLTIQGFFSAEDVWIQLNIPLVFQHRLLVHRLRLIRPAFVVIRDEERLLKFGGAYLAQRERLLQDVPLESSALARGVNVEHLEIEDGVVEIFDLGRPVSQQYRLDQVQVRAFGATYPMTDQRLRFEAESAIPQPIGLLMAGTAAADGWINWPKGEMAVGVNFLSETGATSVTAHLKGQQHDLAVSGRLGFDPGKAGDADEFGHLQHPLFGGLVRTALGQARSPVEAGFAFQTRMDHPVIQGIDISGEIDVAGWMSGGWMKVKEPAPRMLLKPLEFLSGGLQLKN